MDLLCRLPTTAFGGRLLYTVNQKKNGRICAVQIGSFVDISRTIVIAYTKKRDAYALAIGLEATKSIENWTDYPVMGYEFMEIFDLSKYVATVSPDKHVNLTDLYVQKWDSYHLRDYIFDQNIGMLICDGSETEEGSFECSGPLILPSDEPNEYINSLNHIAKIQTHGNNMQHIEDIRDE